MSGDRVKQWVNSSPIQGANSAFVEVYYEEYLKDPESVEPSWREYFQGLNGSGPHDVAHTPIRASFRQLGLERRTNSVAQHAMAPKGAEKQAQVLRLINYYRVRGHQAANLDPLGLSEKPDVPDLDPAFHGLGQQDMETVFNTGSLAVQDNMPLRQIHELVSEVYTKSIGVEYMYITDTPQKRWIQRRLEGTAFEQRLTDDERRNTLVQLTAAEGIERYLHTKYVGQKRFSLEGGDSLIPAMDEVIRKATEGGVDEVIVGMAHRGRLNVLVNILGKSPAELFDEFEGKIVQDDLRWSGDVKYHNGFSTDIEVENKRVHLVLAFNPSHLEIVNPVVEGSVKARQHRRRDLEGKNVLPILVHGDAAFAGQGVNMETLQLSQAKGYSTGGTVHIIVNNQLGFTTPNPIEVSPYSNSRSSLYCTDLAKMLEAPVFHVNADDPDAVVFISRLAVEYRNTFNKDVFVDLVCYRRHGHNEADEPAVTQPGMYKAIKAHPTTRTLYAKKLQDDGLIADGEAAQLLEDYRNGLDEGRNISRNTLGMVGNAYTVDWSRYSGAWDDPINTTIAQDHIKKLCEKLLTLPDGFELHPRVKRIMNDRSKMAAGATPIDWGFAETLAYASLLENGFNVRLSGQDCGRGTFFHRHAVLLNQKDSTTTTPLQSLVDDGENRFVLNDCLLSEEGVLGFEYGYSTADPETLIVWEAQFGDFANVAQVVIDQFIASGLAKWGRLCGLTMFLPHGYEGQGPEHSSARLERYLQLCAEKNMQVCVPSTPAQMFHMLRRQMVRNFRMPLVVMTPKSLLRHKLSVSTLEDFSEGRFQLVIGDRGNLDAEKVKRVVVCSGKIYYDLFQARADQEIDDVAVIRLEQLYPFPMTEYTEILSGFPNATEVVWCQEEPENQGAWYQIKHRLQVPLGDQHSMLYATRAGSASTATGYNKLHVQQQEEVVRQALTGGEPIKGG